MLFVREDLQRLPGQETNHHGFPMSLVGWWALLTSAFRHQWQRFEMCGAKTWPLGATYSQKLAVFEWITQKWGLFRALKIQTSVFEWVKQ
jgi:hypothetical protein